MSIPIILSSSDADAGSSGSDFTTTLRNPIRLNSLNWQVGVVKVNTWFSTHNISAALGNNLFHYEISAVAQTPITLPDGNYTVQSIDDYIKEIMFERGHYDSSGSEPAYYITISPNFNTSKVKVKITSGSNYGVDFTQANTIGTTLGFGSVSFTVSTTGANIADLSAGIDSWVLHCDLTNSSFLNGNSSDALLTFTPRVPQQASIEVEPYNITYAQVNTETIDRIRIRLSDQNSETLELNSENSVVTLKLIPIK